ncbi:iron-containing alcohol dehydrogenase [Neorhizobium sp. P12A]|uniref:iron-containing alcohol dehydrogenase n=1 Tax=Rhizobium/Agrobacterium group TaxID=227290 RepID=UPI001050FE0B|nr:MULTISPECIES: iron-containing alcohol dehydrogenase [Rhizobium/Agrobacterium group]KAA0697191.1 iron-containing alcohol dehydrogenase [Neorhizobium sp. P12A]TCR85956.1 NADP-dependent alcohol dehydrogenase [Rhizobium sp. BK376]
MPLNFDLQNTTRIVFGQGKIADLDHLLSRNERVLLLFGGGSIKSNGVYDQVMRALGDRHVIPFGGIEPNPEYDTILEAARLAQHEKATFVLGVGGGSVIDAAKFLAAIIPVKSGDAWDLLVSGAALPDPLPNGAVLTLPATGSESNPVSVMSRRTRGLKLPFAIEKARPKFAVLDPSTMKSLSRRQLENGVVDAVTHVLEQYLTQPANLPIQYGFSETLLTVLFEAGPKLIDEPTDEVRDTVMWAANQALNGLIGAGAQQDWSTHMIGHSLTALYGIDHARTLSLVMSHLLRDQLELKLAMLARFGRNVWKLEGSDDRAVAMEAIAFTEQFFSRMGCPVRLSELPNIAFDVEHIIEHLEKAHQLPLGERQNLNAEDVRRILKAAA